MTDEEVGDFPEEQRASSRTATSGRLSALGTEIFRRYMGAGEAGELPPR